MDEDKMIYIGVYYIFKKNLYFTFKFTYHSFLKSLKRYLAMKVLIIYNAFSPWSIGTKWPALLTTLNYKNPADLIEPATSPFTFHVVNKVFLNCAASL
jgi:hypothetical protein